MQVSRFEGKAWAGNWFMLTHEEHIARLASVVADQKGRSDASALFDDNLSMVISDVLQCYSPFTGGERSEPDQFYVVGVMMYALGETSRKKLPVELISLGTLVKRVRELLNERSGSVSYGDILAIADLFSLELFKRGDADKRRIADVLHDYIVVVLGGYPHDHR